VSVAASLYEIVLALHIMGVVLAFGVTFAYPIMFAVAARSDPRSLPVLHRIEYTTERWLVNPGLLVVVAAGVFLASDGHHWSEFFVQWGLGAAIVIGAVVGSVMIPTAKRAEQLAARDLAAASARGAVTPGEQAPPTLSEHALAALSDEYRATARRLESVGPLLGVLVLATIFIMAVKP
jgi:hypothetical protein